MDRQIEREIAKKSFEDKIDNFTKALEANSFTTAEDFPLFFELMTEIFESACKYITIKKDGKDASADEILLLLSITFSKRLTEATYIKACQIQDAFENIKSKGQDEYLLSQYFGSSTGTIFSALTILSKTPTIEDDISVTDSTEHPNPYFGVQVERLDQKNMKAEMDKLTILRSDEPLYSFLVGLHKAKIKLQEKSYELAIKQERYQESTEDHNFYGQKIQNLKIAVSELEKLSSSIRHNVFVKNKMDDQTNASYVTQVERIMKNAVAGVHDPHNTFKQFINSIKKLIFGNSPLFKSSVMKSVNEAKNIVVESIQPRQG